MGSEMCIRDSSCGVWLPGLLVVYSGNKLAPSSDSHPLSSSSCFLPLKNMLRSTPDGKGPLLTGPGTVAWQPRAEGWPEFDCAFPFTP